jgi:C-terminal processing protease CtpA/Prc
MGNSDSSLSGDLQLNSQVDYKDQAHIGYRVVSVQAGSPAEQAGIEPQIDFIKYNPFQEHGGKLLSEYLTENEGREVMIPVYNLIQQGTRTVKLKL